MSNPGFPYPGPSFISSTYNPLWFNPANSSLSLAQATQLFYSNTGGVLSGSMTINGNIIGSGTSTLTSFGSVSTTSLSLSGTTVTSTAAQLNYLSGVTAGTAAASKALVLDGSSNIISGIANLVGLASTSFYYSGNSSYSSSISTNANSAFNIYIHDQPATQAVNVSFDSLGQVGLYGIAQGTNGTTPRYPIDLGANNNDVHLCVYQNTGSNQNVWGLGTSTSALELHGGAGNFTFYGGTTGNGHLGTSLVQITSGGNISATSGFYTGFTSTGPSGPGVKIHYGASLGAVFGYDYTAQTPIALELGYTTGGNYHFLLTTTSANAWTNVNSINTTGSCPLAIYGSGNFTRSTGAYGYLNSTAVGNTGSASWTHAMSLYCQYGILCDGGEIDTFSDVRAKENITPLDESMVNRLMSIEPIGYNYIGDQSPKLGYRAQDLLAGMLPDLINFTKIHDEEKYLPEMDVKCDDGFIVHLAKDEKLIVNIIGVIPLLHKALQMQSDRIQKNETIIQQLTSSIQTLIHMQGVTVEQINSLKSTNI